MTSISQSNSTVLIRDCSSVCRENQELSRWYPGNSSFDIIVSHICRESAHSNTGSGFGRCSTGVGIQRGVAVLAAAAAGPLTSVSAVSVGVMLLKSGRTMPGDELTLVHVGSASGIGAH